jgi:hypothetical protein
MVFGQWCGLVVWLSRVRSWVLAIDDLPKDFFGSVVAYCGGVGGGFPAVATSSVVTMGFGIVVEMVVVVGIGVVEFRNVAEMGVLVGCGGGAAAEVEDCQHLTQLDLR